jgi:long-chain fatty acid transport protein
MIKKSSLLIVFLGTNGLANASGFALIEQSASGMGNAFAGAAAVAEDASTIFFNPAGMSYLPDNQLVLGGHAVITSAEFTDYGSKTISPTGTPTALKGGNGGDPGSIGLIPNFYFTKAINDKWRAGIGVNSPYGLKTEYDAGWHGRYQAMKSELITANINPSLAFKVNGRLSLGGGINISYAETNLSSAVDSGTICYGSLNPAVCSGKLGLTPQNADSAITMTGSDWGWGYNLGGIFQVTDALRLGVAYRSGMRFSLNGNANFSEVPAALSAILTPSKITAALNLPDTVATSLAYQLNTQWQLLADVTWTNWETFKQLQVVRANGSILYNQAENWQSSLRYSVGASYQYSDKLKLRYGFALDETPVTSTFRTARTPDSNRFWLSAGLSYQLSTSNHVDVGYTHIFMNDATINQGAVGTPTGQLLGRYDSNINIISAQFNHVF